MVVACLLHNWVKSVVVLRLVAVSFTVELEKIVCNLKIVGSLLHNWAYNCVCNLRVDGCLLNSLATIVVCNPKIGGCILAGVCLSEDQYFPEAWMEPAKSWNGRDRTKKKL